MKPISIRGMPAKMPLICAPLVGATREAVLAEAATALAARADIVEWRVDHFGGIHKASEVIQTGRALRGALSGLPILFTPSEGSQAAGRAYVARMMARKDRDADVSMETVQAQATAIAAYGAEKDETYAHLKDLRQPTLVVIGSKDLQVTPEANLPIIRSALAGNRAARIVELDGLNHLLQPATTGAPSEYGTIPITIAPAALDLITGWVLEQAR